MGAKQRFTLHRERRLVLQLHIHIRARIDNRLIENRYRSHRIVHGIIHILHQRGTTGCHHHTSARDIHRIQSDLIARRTLIFTHQTKLILLRHLLSHHQRRIIQFLEHIFLSNSWIINGFGQITTKWLQHGEYHAPRRRHRRIPFHIVKLTIWWWVITRIHTVHLHHAQQLLAFYRTFHQVLHIRSHRVIAIMHIQFELITWHLRRAYRIDVLHHQIPSAFVLLVGRVIRTLQHFQNQRIRRFQRLATIRWELTHLIHLTAIRIFICHRQHLILIQGCTQRYITQCRIQRVLIATQQTSRLHFLIILTRVHIRYTLQHRASLLYITHTGIRLRQGLVQGIRLIIRHFITLRRPLIIQHMPVRILSQIGKSHDIARLIIITALIRHPHLDTIDSHATSYIGQSLHRLLIVISKVITQEEVTVLIIIIDRYLKVGRLRTALTRYRLTLRVLLRNQCLNTQLAKLQIRLHTKQGRTSAYQTIIQGHRHITRLQRLNNIILLTLEIQLNILLIKIKWSLRIIPHIKIQLIAHFSVHCQLNLLVKIKDIIVSRTLGQWGVIHILVLKAEHQLGRTLQFQLHATRTKDLISWTDIKFHIGYIKLALIIVLYLADFLLPIVAHLLALGIGAILIRSHHIRRCYIHITHTSTEHIAVMYWVILNRSLHIIWAFQVQTTGLTSQIFIIIHPQCLHLHRSHNGSIHHHCQAIFLLSQHT